MKRVILLIIGVIVAGIAMGQVNGNFKSARIINSDSTHGVIPGTIYRGSDLILRWVDEAGVIHRFIKPTALGFWPLTGTGTFTGNVIISGGGSRTLTFNNMSALNMIIDNAVTISSSSSSLSLEGSGGTSILTLGSAATLTASTLAIDLPSSATGDIWYRNAGGLFTRRAIGTSNQFMTVSGGLPVWSTPLATTLNMSTARLLGRTTASTGAVEEITVGTGLSLSGGTLSSTGASDFWKITGTTTLTGNPTIINNGGNELAFTGNGNISMYSNAGNSIIGAAAGVEITSDGGFGVGITANNAGGIALNSDNDITSSAVGSIIFSTNGSVRKTIEPDGSWNIGGSNGTSGQVLTSAGAAAPPTWTTVAGISGLTANRVARASSATTLSDNAGFTWDNTIVTIANQSSDGVPSLNVQAGILVEQSKIGSNNFRTSYNAGSILHELVTGSVSTDDFDISSANGISTSTTGADIILTAGSGFASGNTNGGDVILSPGSSNGSGTPGALKFNGDLHSTSVITDGTYTPSMTNTSNVAVGTPDVCQYMRVGNSVTVSGTIAIDPTAAATPTTLSLSLPIASNFSAFTSCAGTAVAVFQNPCRIIGDSTNDVAVFDFITSSVTTSENWAFTFTYLIQ